MKNRLSFDTFVPERAKLSQICRFCLSGDGILLSIFTLREGQLFAQLKVVLQIEVEEGDGLPSLMCHSCLFNLEKSIDFKNQCEKSDSILRNHIKTLSEKDVNEGEVKDSACQAKIWDIIAENKGVVQKRPEEFETINDVDIDSNKIAITAPKEIISNAKKILAEETQQNHIQHVNKHMQDSLELEESMNELEEGMYGSEPFSLDLCSVRLQSEGQEEAVTLALQSSSQLTDEDQWSDTASENSEELESAEPTTQSDKCNCTACNKAFTNTSDLLRHQLIHKQEPPYPCDYCNKDFDEKMLLKAHWRTHAKNKPHMCLTCGEAYMERSELVKHFAVHDVIKPYHCSGCGKAFAYRSDLRKHAIIHTGARPFKCPVCGKTFTRSTNLNKHARVHSGQRPYPCDHCDKMFSSRGDLVRHAVIHTGEKPYACLICSLAFNRKDKLSRHERVHITDRPFACAECPTSFHRKEELTKHIRFHHFKPDPEYFGAID